MSQIVSLKKELSRFDTVELQIIVLTALDKVRLSAGEITCLTYLAIAQHDCKPGEELLISEFSDYIKNEEQFSSHMVVRNIFTSLIRKGYVHPDPARSKKKLRMTDKLALGASSVCMLDYKFKTSPNRAVTQETQSAN
jgi:hypothetical protein